MVELARTFVSRLRHFFGDRRSPKRVRARLPFSVSLVERRPSGNGSRRVRSLDGHTYDLSATGLGLIVSAIRIGEHYLVGDGRLEVRLELPAGPVEMEMAPVRYESLEEHDTETGYLIGARIVFMKEEHRTLFTEYLTKR